MSRINPAEAAFQAAIPGEAMTVPPGQLPFDRPAQISSAPDAMESVMRQIKKPKVTQRILGALNDNVPLDTIAGMIAKSMYGEGVISPSLIPHVTLSLVEVFFYMAEQANVTPTLSSDLGGKPEEEVTEADIELLSEEDPVEIFEDQAAEEVGGLMSPPEGEL